LSNTFPATLDARCGLIDLGIFFGAVTAGWLTGARKNGADALFSPFGSNPVIPTLTGRIELLSSVRPVFLFRFGRDANGRSVAEKL
jgi:hypothetical protein